MSIANSEAPVAAPPKRRKVRLLEFHVTHTCNLTCESCSHYSNHAHEGRLSLAEADEWMGLWSPRLHTPQVNLLGGEPTVHPDLVKFIPLVRGHWPRARIGIVTNGFFLHRQPALPAAIVADGNTFIRLSVHHAAPEYVAHLQPIFDLLAAWKRDFGIESSVNASYKGWTRRYQGQGGAMLPFEDNDPRKSWEICPARSCKQIYQGKLWKCAPLAYLHLQKEKFPQLSDKWDEYLRYQPLDAGCSDEEFDRFLATEEESACSMCSATRRPLALPIPVRNMKSLAVRPSSAPEGSAAR